MTAPPEDRSPHQALSDLAVSDRAVLDALPRAIIVTSAGGRIVLWNAQAEALYGWCADEVIGRSVMDVLVPLPGKAQAEDIVDQVISGDAWVGDFTVLRRNGDPLRVRVTDQPILGGDGNGDGKVVAIVGVSEDVTAERLAQQRSADLTDHLRLALDAGGLGTWRWDIASGISAWDTKMESLFGLPPETYDGSVEAWRTLLHPDDADRTMSTVEQAVEDRSRYTVEHRVVWPDGSVHWLLGSGQVTVDETGDATGTIGCAADVTERVEAEQERERLVQAALEAAEQERLSRERLEFLGRINHALSEATSRQEVMANVVHQAVPELGDWCSIYVLPDSGNRIPDVEVAHVDPTMVAYARKLQARFPYDPSALIGVPAVIRTGETSFLAQIGAADIDEAPVSEDARAVLRHLGIGSAITVPLVKHRRILGAIQFVMSEPHRRYTPDDVALAEAVAGRIASSLENQRLADKQRSIASALQAALLAHDLPVIPGVERAVRYWAAGEGIEVGGDFYDSFHIEDGRWAAVIGDVCGSGPTAAAITGLVRHTIASAAWHGDDPAEVLGHLNRTIRSRHLDTFCTVAYVTVEPSAQGATVELACGGHPLPVLARADGTVGTWGRPGTLVGVFDDYEATSTSITLGPGDALVFFTDGVTDVRAPYGLTSEDFAGMVGRAARVAESADDLADRLQQNLSTVLSLEDRTDDIALLILRVPEATGGRG